MVEKWFKKYCDDSEKRTEDIIAIIMIVNHLREWISPGFGPDSSKNWPVAKTPADDVSRKVYEHPMFSTIRKLCNGTKHAKKVPVTATAYETDVYKWSNVYDVKDVYKGSPCRHLVDCRPVETFIEPIMELYRAWF
jgi:hypothetical protein